MTSAQEKQDSEGNSSILKELMSQMNLGGQDDLDNQADELEAKSNAKKQEPYGIEGADQLAQDLYPYLEFHDKVMRAINDALSAIGIEALVEKLSEAVSIFVFSLISPFMLPVLNQVKAELKEGSGEIIQSSEQLQHVVFEDESSSNPTHSMLSKDHFTNLLNEPAGKVASTVLKFVVPQLMQAWDDTGIDVNRLMDEIVGAVFHHPALRNGEDNRGGVEGRQRMFAVVESWWQEKSDQERDDLRQRLSADGVRDGRNHKEGIDHGHGCGKPLKMNQRPGGSQFESMGSDVGKQLGGAVQEALGGGGGGGGDSGGFGALGGMLGGAFGAALNQTFNAEEPQEEPERSSYGGGNSGGSYGGSGGGSYGGGNSGGSYGGSGGGSYGGSGGGRSGGYEQRKYLLYFALPPLSLCPLPATA